MNNFTRALECADRYAIIRAGFAVEALSGGEFDLIFLDPPYGAGHLSAGLEAGSLVVGPETLLIVEHATRDPSPEAVGAIERTREVIHGDSALAFYRSRRQP